MYSPSCQPALMNADIKHNQWKDKVQHIYCLIILIPPDNRLYYRSWKGWWGLLLPAWEISLSFYHYKKHNTRTIVVAVLVQQLNNSESIWPPTIDMVCLLFMLNHSPSSFSHSNSSLLLISSKMGQAAASGGRWSGYGNDWPRMTVKQPAVLLLCFFTETVKIGLIPWPEFSWLQFITKCGTSSCLTDQMLFNRWLHMFCCVKP